LNGCPWDENTYERSVLYNGDPAWTIMIRRWFDDECDNECDGQWMTSVTTML